jgi:predicted N-acyltransferase
MEVEIVDTIGDIREEEWNAVIKEDFPEMTHAWYKTVEDSGMRTLKYVVVRENGTLKAVACCHLYDEERLVMKTRFLEVGCPLGTARAFFSENAQQTKMLLEGVEELRRRVHAKGSMILDLGKKDYDFFKNHIRGFTTLSTKDRTFLDVDFNDFEEYLSSLNSSSRRSIRKTLHRNENRWKIKHILTSDFSQWKGVARTLQKYTCEQHGDFRMHLTEQLYEALGRNLKEKAELTLFFKDDIPLACGMCLNSPTVAVHKFAGVDPRYKKYQAYFLLYYEGIKTAIERGQKRIYFGTTTYEFKEKIGCTIEPMFGFAKLNNPLLNVLLKFYLARFYPVRHVAE